MKLIYSNFYSLIYRLFKILNIFCVQYKLKINIVEKKFTSCLLLIKFYAKVTNTMMNKQ